MIPITREWILSQLPLRTVEKKISRALKGVNFSPVLKWVLRKGYVPREDVGLVDVDVELGKFYVHEMGIERVYLEAVYSGTIDVDVKIKGSEYVPFSDYKIKSFLRDIEVVAEIDIENQKITSFEIGNFEVF